MLELDVQFHDALNKVYADSEFSDIINKPTIYPVLKFRLGGRIF